MFLFGQIGFWILVGIFVIGATVCIETASAGFATFLTIVAAALLWKNLDVLTWQQWLVGAGAYFVVGGLWSVARWFLHVREYVREFNAKRVSDYELNSATNSKGQKSRIYMWIAYWPLSMIWTVCDDLVVNIVRTIFRALSGTYESITKSALQGVKK